MKRLLTKTIAILLLTGCLSTGFAEENEDSKKKQAIEVCVFDALKSDLNSATYNNTSYKIARILEFLYFSREINDCICGEESGCSKQNTVDNCYTYAFEMDDNNPVEGYISNLSGFQKHVTGLINLHKAFNTCLKPKGYEIN
jgi:hypothetical protein